MKRKLTGFSRRYHSALRKHLQGPGNGRAGGLGHQAMTIGIETLDLARIHEQALVSLVLPDYSPDARESMVRRAGAFFAQAITPIEKTHRTAREANIHLNQMVQTLSQRRLELIAANRQLK